MNILLKPTNNFSKKGEHFFSQILGEKIHSIRNITYGGNNRIYLLKTQKNKKYIAKHYFIHHKDTRDRLSIEYNSLEFLWKEGIRSIPQPIAIFAQKQLAIYEYIEGKRLSTSETTVKNIWQVAQFVSELDMLKTKKESLKFPIASEACFCFHEIIDSIRNRYQRLRRLKIKNIEYHNLEIFLIKEFDPIFQEIYNWCRKNLAKHQYSFSTATDINQCTLSSSDFGFHNALQKADGKLVFLDFEYFGWDDPVKMVSDFLLHPHMYLNHSLKKIFTQKMISYFGRDNTFFLRLQNAFPLFALKWCLILLNEFLPIDYQRRQFASKKQLNKKLILQRQIKKAKKMLSFIKRNYIIFPYQV